MSSDPSMLMGRTADSRLRNRIISTYRRAQRIIAMAAASAPANTHAAMALTTRPATISFQTSCAPGSSFPTPTRSCRDSWTMLRTTSYPSKIA